jgi:hypothetical protein
VLQFSVLTGMAAKHAAALQRSECHVRYEGASSSCTSNVYNDNFKMSCDRVQHYILLMFKALMLYLLQSNARLLEC